MIEPTEDYAPRAFISYTWDSEEHKDKARKLSDLLRENGVDCNIDQYEISPPEGWTHWAINQVEESDYVLIVSTESYNLASRKAQNQKLDKNSVWQADLITTILYQKAGINAGSKFIPIVFNESDVNFIPIQLKDFTHYNLNEKENPKGFELLYKHILKESNKPQVKLKNKKAYTKICPYRGLAPFREEDASYFFGREKFIEKLIREVHDKTLVSIIGASGSGKSSVVYAGLIPHLKKTENAIIMKMRPGLDPILAMSYSVVNGIADAEGQKLSSAELDNKASLYQADLLSGKETLESLTRTIRNDKKRPIVIFIDQFEEILTLGSDEKKRKLFLSSVNHLAETLYKEKDDTCNIILTMRIDFLGKALGYPESAQIFSDKSSTEDYIKKMIIGPMDSEELMDSIEKPAIETGLNLEKGLSELIVQSLGKEPGNLPLLEFCLLELWKKQEQANRGIMTISDYEEIGGAQGALVKHADEVYRNLPETEKDRVRQIFIQLVQPGENTGDTRKISTMKEIGEENFQLVKKLADERLVVISRTLSGETTIEVVHEALIREWGLLKGWMDADRHFRLWQENLNRLKKIWDEESIPGNLLKGNKLIESEEWLGKKKDYLNETQIDFIQKSLENRNAEKKKEKEESERKRKLQLRITFASLIGVVIAAALSAFSFIQLKESQAHETEAIYWIAHSSYNDPGKYFNGFYTALKAGFKAKELNDTYDEVQKAKLTLLEYIHQFQKPDVYKKDASDIDKFAFAKEIANLPNQSPVWSISKSPDDKVIAAGCNNGTIKIWIKMETGEYAETNTLTGHTGLVRSVQFSPDGKFLVSGSKDKSIKIWNVEKLLKRDNNIQPTQTIQNAHLNNITSLIFSPIIGSSQLEPIQKEYTLVSASYDLSIKTWTINENGDHKLNKTLYGHKKGINALSYCSDGKMFASGADDSVIKFWNLDDKGEIKEGKTFLTHNKDTRTGMLYPVTEIEFTKDCKKIISGSWDKTIKVWDAVEFKEIKKLSGHSDHVRSVTISPDDKFIYSASRDNSIKIWTNGIDNEYREIKTLTGHSSGVYTVVVSSDGKTIYSGSFDGSIKAWRVGEYNDMKTLTNHIPPDSNNLISAAVFSPDGKYLAVASIQEDYPKYSKKYAPIEYLIKIWNLSDYTEMKTLVGHTKPITSMVFSLDGKYLFSGSNDYTIKIWSIFPDKIATKSNLVTTLAGHTKEVTSLSLSPDGKILASGSKDNTIKIWKSRFEDKKKEFPFEFYEKFYDSQPLKGHAKPVTSVNFNEDGTALASGSEDKTIKIWTVDKNLDFQNIKTLSSHTEEVTSVLFSPNKKILASASGLKDINNIEGISSGENAIKIWEIGKNNEYNEIKTLIGHTDGITSLSFNANGSILASSSEDNTVRIWNMDDHTLIKEITGHSEKVNTVAFSPKSKLIITSSNDNKVKIIENNLNHLLATSCLSLMPYFNMKSFDGKYGYNYEMEDKEHCMKVLDKANKYLSKEEMYRYHSAIYKKDYDAAISLKPELPMAYIYRSVEKNKPDDFQKAIELEKDKIYEVYYMRGYAYERSGKYFYNKAMEDYKKALELKPDFLEAKLALEALEKK